MKLSDYIQGNRRGKEANRLEREALTDPFLSDALDGYRESGENGLPAIEKLQNRVAMRARRTTNRMQIWSAAAVLLLLLGSGTYLLNRANEEADFYYSLAENEFIWGDLFDHEYTLEDAMSEVRQRELLAATEPVPLFSFPLPIGGESYIEPYLPILKEEYDVLHIDPALQQEGAGRKPEPAVDNYSYARYLADHIQIPIEGVCNRTKGKVTVAFRVNPSGRPYDIRVVKGLCESLDKEAIRLVREGPDFRFGDREVKMTIQL